MKMADSSPNGKKTLWEKEKLLVTSNFSFFHSVFKRLVLQTRENQGLFGKGLITPASVLIETGHLTKQEGHDGPRVPHLSLLHFVV